MALEAERAQDSVFDEQEADVLFASSGERIIACMLCIWCLYTYNDE